MRAGPVIGWLCREGCHAGQDDLSQRSLLCGVQSLCIGTAVRIEHRRAQLWKGRRGAPTLCCCGEHLLCALCHRRAALVDSPADKPPASLRMPPLIGDDSGEDNANGLICGKTEGLSSREPDVDGRWTGSAGA